MTYKPLNKMIKHKLIPFLFAGIFFMIACSNKPDNKFAAITSDSIPEGAIPFEYGRTKKIILKGVLNDSIPLNVTFDTGGGSCINLSDSLKGKFGLNKAGAIGKLQIGKNTKNFPVYFNTGKETSKILGSNGAIINWKYFEGKILKISFRHKYIQVYDNELQKSGYVSIPMRINNDRFIMIPLQVQLQGKVIKEDFWFDTGYNGPVYLEKVNINKYMVKIDESDHSSGITHSGNIDFIDIKTDSIGIINCFIPSLMLSFGNIFENKSNISGIVGNGFFENFDIILDLKNFVLYLKPVEVSNNVITSK
jgi:hypothetical protein